MLESAARPRLLTGLTVLTKLLERAFQQQSAKKWHALLFAETTLDTVPERVNQKTVFPCPGHEQSHHSPPYLSHSTLEGSSDTQDSKTKSQNRELSKHTHVPRRVSALAFESLRAGLLSLRFVRAAHGKHGKPAGKQADAEQQQKQKARRKRQSAKLAREQTTEQRTGGTQRQAEEEAGGDNGLGFLGSPLDNLVFMRPSKGRAGKPQNIAREGEPSNIAREGYVSSMGTRKEASSGESKEQYVKRN